MVSSRKLRVGVLFGGRSGEHEVSLNSARNVMDALARAGHTVIPIGITPQGRWLANGDPMTRLTAGAGAKAFTNGRTGRDAADSWGLLPTGRGAAAMPAIDVIFPVLHGTYGEDGTVQGMLEMANLPYVGCGVLASATAMDKAISKQLFAQAGLAQAPYRVLMRARLAQDRAGILDELEAALGYPMFVKPANLGSSVGISKAHDRTELADALELAARFDRKLVIEAAVPDAREIEIGVLGNDEPEVSVPGEIIPGNEFYDYDAKYVNDNSRLLIPAELSFTQREQIAAMALIAFTAVDGSGLARVDFLVSRGSGEIFINELNTLPGFTRISMYPKLWEASGVPYPELVDRLLDLAVERFEDKQRNSTSFAD